MKSEKDEGDPKDFFYCKGAHPGQLVWRGPEGEMIIRGIVSPAGGVILGSWH